MVSGFTSADIHEAAWRKPSKPSIITGVAGLAVVAACYWFKLHQDSISSTLKQQSSEFHELRKDFRELRAEVASSRHSTTDRFDRLSASLNAWSHSLSSCIDDINAQSDHASAKDQRFIAERTPIDEVGAHATCSLRAQLLVSLQALGFCAACLKQLGLIPEWRRRLSRLGPGRRPVAVESVRECRLVRLSVAHCFLALAKVQADISSRARRAAVRTVCYYKVQACAGLL